VKRLPSIQGSDPQQEPGRRDIRVRRSAVWLHLAVNLLMLGTFGYITHISWTFAVHETTDRLTRDAGTASALLQNALSDASKILDVAREDLEAGVAEGALSRRRAYEALHHAVQRFSIYTTSDSMGLLLYLDPSGRLMARSGEFPSEELDLSDRRYFLDLRENPSRRFALGRLRVAKTTGKHVFHLSMPVHDTAEKLAGVVAIQIDEKELSRMLRPMLDPLESQITVLTHDGRCLFRYPSTAIPTEEGDPLDPLLATGRGTGDGEWFVIPPGKATDRQRIYTGYHDERLFGLRTTATTDFSGIFHLYLRRNMIPSALTLSSLVIVNLLFAGLYRQTRKLNQARFEALVDHLTLVGNRRAMELELKRLWLDVGRRDEAISVLFMDIDHFKAFNDFYGHEIGDRVLKEVAGLIESGMKRPLDFCCRWGGEEFVAVLPDTDLQEARTVAENIRKSLASLTVNSMGRTLPGITLSIGIASTREVRRVMPAHLVEKADRAMLRAKLDGRDCVVTAEDGEGIETLVRS